MRRDMQVVDVRTGPWALRGFWGLQTIETRGATTDFRGARRRLWNRRWIQALVGVAGSSKEHRMLATRLDEMLCAEAGGDDLRDAVDSFMAVRPGLFNIALRVTRDIGDAEDVVQEAWMRWQRTDRTVIGNPAAFLTTATTRLAINVIQSARHRHERPCDAPVDGSLKVGDDIEWQLEQRSTVEESLDLLMSRLTPAELAAYVLRKGFDYDYSHLADLLGTSLVNVRQLVRRAQVRSGGGRRREVSPERHARLVAAFLAAARSGNLAGLEERLLDELSRNGSESLARVAGGMVSSAA